MDRGRRRMVLGTYYESYDLPFRTSAEFLVSLKSKVFSLKSHDVSLISQDFSLKSAEVYLNDQDFRLNQNFMYSVV